MPGLLFNNNASSILLYPIHLENLSFAVEKTIGFNLDGV